MNKTFMKKIIRAKMLEYEAIKEIMPGNLKKRITHLEKETLNIVKDIVLELISESDDEESNMKEDQASAKKATKISVDFN
jgi:hypothetical protein